MDNTLEATITYVHVPSSWAEEFEHHFPLGAGDFFAARNALGSIVQFQIYIHDWHEREEQRRYLLRFPLRLSRYEKTDVYQFWNGPAPRIAAKT